MTANAIHFLEEYLPAELSETIKVGWAPIELLQGEKAKNILSDEEQAEWKAFESEARRREYVATRQLVYQLAKQLPIVDKGLELKKDKWGKPYGLSQGTTYAMSIAHTRQHVLCGLSSNKQLGVDLEPVNRKLPDKLRNRILNSDEKTLLSSVPTLRIWTIKEALVKLQGRGLRTNLHSCTVLGKDEAIFTAKFNDDKRAKICSFERLNNWMAFAWNS